MSRNPGRHREGFVLPAAIIALVLLATLVVGVLFVATEELRAGRSDVAEQRALTLAEWGIEQTISSWATTRHTALAVGATIRADVPSTTDGDVVAVTVTRTQPRAVWVVARASARDGRALPARRAIGASFRLIGPAFPLRAALTAGGVVVVQSGGAVDGQGDTVTTSRSSWCADDAPASVAGVIAPDSARVCGPSCTGDVPVGITGAPPVAVPAASSSDSVFSAFGEESRSSLTARATVILGPGTFTPRPVASPTTCDATAPLNWGDPAGTTVCADHYPIVWVRGDAVLATGSVGQGILLVDGDLTLDPGVRFAGVVVARDDIIVRGPDATIAGAAFAADADGTDATRVVDGGVIRFAGCAARVAMLGAARLARTPARWWAELR
jgi:hypothetical protein